MKYIKNFEERIIFGHQDHNLYKDIKDFICYSLYLFPNVYKFDSEKKIDSVVMIFSIIEMQKEERSKSEIF